jgi:hypothetical protein
MIATSIETRRAFLAFIRGSFTETDPTRDRNEKTLCSIHLVRFVPGAIAECAGCILTMEVLVLSIASTTALVKDWRLLMIDAHAVVEERDAPGERRTVDCALPLPAMR